MKHSRKVLKITGADRAKFLNDLLTIEIKENMELRYGAFLSAQGKMATDLFVWSQDDALYLDLPASQYDSAKAKFSMYKLRAAVELSDTDLGVYQSKMGVVDPRNADLGCRYYGVEPDEQIAEDAYTEKRVANLIPEFDTDFQTNEAYPIEWRFNEMGGIDYKKGCYIGQEIAARMRHKAVLQKSILVAAIEGEPHDEAQVKSGEKIVGKLLTVSGDKAMIFVKLSATSAEMSVGSARLTLSD